jgi:cytidyltransferase-like protein
MHNFQQFFILNEGGAGGHMAHPFDVDTVRTGKDLIEIFNKSIQFLTKNTAPLKIDGANASVRLVTNAAGNKEFALYRGAKVDVQKGITIDKLAERFSESPGLIKLGTQVLTIFNEALPGTTKELKALGLYDDEFVFFNTEYVSGSTNVIGYKNNFLAIHLLDRIIEKRSALRNSISYTSQKIPYDTQVLEEYVRKVDAVAEKYKFKVIHQIPARLKEIPTLNTPLSEILIINNQSKSLKEWLDEANNPVNKSISLKTGKSISAINQGLYLDVVERQAQLGDLVEPSGIKLATDGIVFWHATRLLGKEILDKITSDLGPGSTQEGIVINSKKVAPIIFKITGDFFIRNQLSPFKKIGKPPSKIVVIYPGRFQPFHLGHASVYNSLKKQFPGADVIIATSDKTDPIDSPFTFDERKKMIVASEVDVSAVQKTVNPYLAKEILAKYDPSSTVAIFAVGKKDMEGTEARFKFGLKKDGTPTYYQPFKSVNDCLTFDKNGYIVTAPTLTFKVLGKPVTGATAIRDLWRKSNEENKKQIIKDLYGKFIPELYRLFLTKIR